MDKKLRIAGIVGAFIISIVILTSPFQNPIKIPSPATVSGNKTIELVVENLQDPRSITVDNRDQIYVAEKKGTIYLVRENETGWYAKNVVNLDVAETIDGGLLDLALHPEFPKNRMLYAYYTYFHNETADLLKNKVVRLKLPDTHNPMESGIIDKVILDKIPAGKFNNGGIIEFGPDDKLYVGTGVARDDHQSQDIKSFAGKILRLDPSGSIPNDNPFSQSPVYSYGHRNPSGMAWDKQGNMYLSEMGPTKNDEINLIKAGENYGWPHHECGSPDPKFKDPTICYNPAVIPSGMLFYDFNKLNIKKGALILSTLRGNGLFAVSLVTDNQIRTQKDTISATQISQDTILTGVGRLSDVAKDSSGNLYVLTGNTDGKGFPAENDDRILKIKR